MLSIYATIEQQAELAAIIAQEDRLAELIRMADYLTEKPEASADSLLVKRGEIWPLIDWHNLEPPYLLPESIELSAPTLLGLIFAKLRNYEKAKAYLAKSHPTLYLELDIINRMQQGLSVRPEELISDYSPFDEYRLMHNQAVVRHYSDLTNKEELDKARYFFLEALQAAPNEEYRAFTAWRFADLLVDLYELEDAERVVNAAFHPSLSEAGKTELRYTLCEIWMPQLRPPYDPELLSRVKDNLWKVLEAYRKQNRPAKIAMALTDAGSIANYTESWSESLGYLNEAIQIFEREEVPEMAANAHYRKGILLFTWAQSGNPQFYRGAAESYQKAAKIFTRQAAPALYADLQHHLGIIYSEIPDEAQKKGIWAAVSSSAFQEALRVHTKTEAPYEYAAICNHYANALTKYPEAKQSDNIEKALFYYQEALDIRDPKEYPMEYCLTSLNYLEAQWMLSMPEDRFDEARYADMLVKAEAVLRISPDPELKEIAQRHLDELSRLRTAYIN